MGGNNVLCDLVKQYEGEILDRWMKEQIAAITLRADLMSEADLRRQSQEFLAALQIALQKADDVDIAAPAWLDVRAMLSAISSSRAKQGFTPSDTATFVLSLKQPLFGVLQRALGGDPPAFAAETWNMTVLLDGLSLITVESFVKGREETIRRQQDEMLELSTPVVKLWNQILALPLIGTLDSMRTQVVMETLLQEIVNTSSSVAIIDITGVPTVDTLVAQHLMKTVSAARLMGAECIISGIRPQIAQTMVHLGVAFSDVVTKASLADAIKYAFKKTGHVVTKAAS